MHDIFTDSSSHQKFTASVLGRFSDIQALKVDGIKLFSMYMEVFSILHLIDLWPISEAQTYVG